jgi:hypothetical protein
MRGSYVRRQRMTNSASPLSSLSPSTRPYQCFPSPTLSLPLSQGELSHPHRLTYTLAHTHNAVLFHIDSLLLHSITHTLLQTRVTYKGCRISSRYSPTYDLRASGPPKCDFWTWAKPALDTRARKVKPGSQTWSHQFSDLLRETSACTLTVILSTLYSHHMYSRDTFTVFRLSHTVLTLLTLYSHCALNVL